MDNIEMSNTGKKARKRKKERNKRRARGCVRAITPEEDLVR